MAEEKNFEDRVKRFLKEHHCWYVKYWGGGSFTKAGIPDLLVCCNGYFMGIELKAEKGEPTMLQLQTLKRIREAGGYGILLYAGDFKAFMKWYGDQIKGKAWYLDNIEMQHRWIAKLKERSSEDDSKEEGST